MTVSTTHRFAPLQASDVVTGRWRTAFADVRAMTWRNTLRTLREPTDAILGVTVPIMIVLVFGYVFGNAIDVGGGDYREVLVPGAFVMAMLSAIAATATAMANDASRGVIDRFRSMPISSTSVALGRAITDLARAVVELALMALCGLLVGWRWHGSLGDAALAFALVLLLRVALTWAGIFVGLAVRDADVASVIVYPLVFPLTALSNTFVPTDSMPAGLRWIAEWNPLSATVAATRDLFGNPEVAHSGGWASEHALGLAVAWPIVLLCVFVLPAVRRARTLGR